MKIFIKMICVLLCFVQFLSLCGCGLFFSQESKEQEAYAQTLTALFEALDAEDKEAVYALFSSAAKEQDEDLYEQIDQLMRVHTGPTDEIGWDELLGQSAHLDHGDRERSAFCTFPIRCGDTYYWCYLKLMYENTVDESQIGITQLNFYTADEYCLFRDDEQSKIEETAGLFVYAQKTIEGEVRCIDGDPYKYTACETPLKLDEMRDFLKTSDDYESFTARFGAPNAERIYCYYELPDENGAERYLRLGVDKGEIYGASIVDRYEYIETVFDGE